MLTGGDKVPCEYLPGSGQEKEFFPIRLRKEDGTDLWGVRKKKSWRRIRTRKENVIRRFCIAALVLESAWGIQAMIQTGTFQECQVVEKSEEGGPGFKKSIYGITIQWKDGELQIYRQDEYWKEE